MNETLDVQTMLGINAEPKRKNRWIVEWEGIDTFSYLSAARPQVTINPVEIPHMNIKRKVAGKPTWNDIAFTLIDYISPSSMQKMYEKLRTVYDPVTGTMGYPAFYQQDMSIKMTGPGGEVVEKWTVVAGWVGDLNGEELDYNAEGDFATVAGVLTYNWAILEY